MVVLVCLFFSLLFIIRNSSDVIEAHQLLAQGKRNIVCGEVHHAVLQFQQACELLSKKYGEVADECAEAYFCYGKALLEYARFDNGVLGNAINSGNYLLFDIEII